jgi:hypothetical protein
MAATARETTNATDAVVTVDFSDRHVYGGTSISVRG